MPLSPKDFAEKLPLITRWIAATLSDHSTAARPVASLGFTRLPGYFSSRTLASAKVVVVARPPQLPLSQMGLSQFAAFEQTQPAGITYLDTFFVRREYAASESLHFHEMIHVVQWKLLGAERFVAAYADGLDRFGYRDSPLEVMAYDAEDRFVSGDKFDAETLVSDALD